MKQRIDRLREQLKEEVSDILRKLRDPRIGFVTITDAEISVDLRYAKIFFTVYGDNDQIALTTEGLNSAAGFIRGELGRRIRIKYTPEIAFHFDPSAQRAARIHELLQQIANEPAGVSDDSDADGEHSADEPATDKPAADKPATDKPATDEPSADESERS